MGQFKPATYVTAPQVNMAGEAVRRRIRRKWERRRAATAVVPVLTAVGEDPRRPGRGVRVIANAETVERCLTRPATAARLFAQIERTAR